MSDLATITSTFFDATKRNVRAIDQGLRFPNYPFGEVQSKQRLISSVRQRVFTNALSDSSTSVWVFITNQNNHVPTIPKDISTDELFLPQEDVFLHQFEEDLANIPTSVRESRAGVLCRRFAEGVGIALASICGVRCATFGDEEDGIALVAHSRLTKRQISFEFACDEDRITIIMIDEEMRRTEKECKIDHVLTLGNAIAWLNPH